MFKSGSQRRFLFAMDKDKQKGLNPIEVKSNSNSISTKSPGTITQPYKAYSLGTLTPKKFHPPAPKSINPTAVPSLPALPKMAKFGRIKKYIKG